MKATGKSLTVNRRDFLKQAGCFSIGFSLSGYGWPAPAPPADELPGSLQDQPRIDSWLEVMDDGRVRVMTGKMELGQGIRTAIAQVAADELDMDVIRVEVHLAETGRTPHEGYTAGSGSIENSAMSVRYAAAAARQKLLEIAAKQWNMPAGQLTFANGKISTSDGQREMNFAQLLKGARLEEEVKLPVALKPKENYRWVGKAVPRKDIENMVRAEAVYVQDLRFPDMVHARVIRPRTYQCSLLPFDEKTLTKGISGLLKLVKNGNFLGVITTEEYEAVQAQARLQERVQWSSPQTLPADSFLPDYIRNLPTETKRVEERGDTSPAGLRAGDTLKASYFKPYLMHASIGPSCAVALYQNGQLHLWTHSQGVYPLQEALSKMLGMATERIHITGVPGSGCYGHNGADDVAADAALLALAYPNQHVRLQWSRDDEHAWEPYGSAMRMDLEARLDANGRISHWHHDQWSDAHSTRPGGQAENLLAARHLEKPFAAKPARFSGGAYRNSEPYYDIPNLKVEAHFFVGPLRVSALRSLGAYANVFAIESFMDELAEKAGKDPLDFRLLHLKDERAVAVIEKVREMTRKEKTGKNEGIGFAFARYKNTASYCAVAAKVMADKKTGDVRVLRMWSAIDAGEVINPDGIINQTEGGMIQAASWTLREEVRFDQQHVSSRDWLSYPIFRFSDVPEVEVAVIARPNEKALGAGEAAQGPAGAAVVNAIYRACGKRVRQLPVRPEAIKG
jgi:CO/xanthine dehydrogenase Mo-binding subunit